MDKGLEKELGDYFSKRGDVVVAYLFGSQVHGNTGPLSDTDVAVLVDSSFSPREQFEIKLEVMQDIKDMLKTEAVDVVLLNEAPPLLTHRIVRDGKILFSGNERVRLDFELRGVLGYLDWKPHLERLMNYTLKPTHGR